MEEKQGAEVVEVVNDIAVILRVQGKLLGSAEIFEMQPNFHNEGQFRNQKYNQHVAFVAGRHMAFVLRRFAQQGSFILRKDNTLTYAWLGFNRYLKDADPLPFSLGAVPQVATEPQDMKTRILERLNRPIGGL